MADDIAQDGAKEYDAFFSHSSKDAALAKALCELVESRGLRCWIAPRDVPPGADWPTSISVAIRKSQAMVLLVSAESNRSDQVRNELTLAAHEGLLILPILVERVALSPHMDYFLLRRHWLELWSATLEQHADKLNHAVRRKPDWETGTLAPSWRRRLRYRPQIFWSSLAAALVVALLAGGITAALIARQQAVDQARTDQSYLSLGYVSLRAERAPERKDIDAEAVVYLYSDDTPYAEVSLTIAGTGDTGGSESDLGPRLNRAQVGGPQRVAFRAEAIAPRVVACLGLPHPRLKQRWRVTQVFASRSLLESAAGREVFEFSPVGAAATGLDDGSPCRPAN